MPKGIPFTHTERQVRRLEIAHVAAKLFFEKGFRETSVSQIAKAVGMGKSTLYEFFDSKDEIILLLLEEPLAEVQQRALVIANEGGTIFQCLSRILHMHLEVLLRDRAFIFKLSYEFQRLPLDIQAQHEVIRQTYQDLLVGLINEGIADGSFRAVDADMVMKILLSILSTVILTKRPTGTPDEMLDQALDLILKGIQQ